MNICCGENTDKHDLVNRKQKIKVKDKLIDYIIEYDNKIYLTLEQTKLRFNEIPGVFHVDDIIPSGSQIKNYDELKMKIEEKEDKIESYSKKIRDLDLKLANMEKVLLMDDKEQQFIHLLGQNNKQ